MHKTISSQQNGTKSPVLLFIFEDITDLHTSIESILEHNFQIIALLHAHNKEAEMLLKRYYEKVEIQIYPSDYSYDAMLLSGFRYCIHGLGTDHILTLIHGKDDPFYLQQLKSHYVHSPASIVWSNALWDESSKISQYIFTIVQKLLHFWYHLPLLDPMSTLFLVQTRWILPYLNSSSPFESLLFLRILKQSAQKKHIDITWITLDIRKKRTLKTAVQFLKLLWV